MPRSRALTARRRSRPSAYDEVALTSILAPTGLAARCSSWTRVPTLVSPVARSGSSAAHVAASHHASSRGVPSTGSEPLPTASAVSSSPTVKVKVVVAVTGAPW